MNVGLEKSFGGFWPEKQKKRRQKTNLTLIFRRSGHEPPNFRQKHVCAYTLIHENKEMESDLTIDKSRFMNN